VREYIFLEEYRGEPRGKMDVDSGKKREDPPQKRGGNRGENGEDFRKKGKMMPKDGGKTGKIPLPETGKTTRTKQNLHLAPYTS